MMPDYTSFFSIPAPLRRLFDSFPLVTYPPASLPARCPSPHQLPTLYVFSTSDDPAGRPSWNPTCLKWQTFLKLSGVRYRTIASSNHGSPSGALPFLIPADDGKPVVVSDLSKWIRSSSIVPEKSPEMLAFEALLNTRIRDAWLYALYLEPRNFQTLAKTLCRSTSVHAVNALLASEYRAAALAELQKFRPGGVVSATDVYADADAAFGALSGILAEGSGEWFFGSSQPSEFDAAVFGYTHLILTLSWSEREQRLQRIVQKYPNIVEHERRIWKRCYS